MANVRAQGLKCFAVKMEAAGATNDKLLGAWDRSQVLKPSEPKGCPPYTRLMYILDLPAPLSLTTRRAWLQNFRCTYTMYTYSYTWPPYALSFVIWALT